MEKLDEKPFFELFMRNSAQPLIPIFHLHLPVVMRSKPSIMVWTDAVSHLVEYFQLGDEQVCEGGNRR